MRRMRLFAALLLCTLVTACSSDTAASIRTQADVARAAALGAQYIATGDTARAAEQLALAAEPNAYRSYTWFSQLTAELSGSVPASLLPDTESQRLLASLHLRGDGIRQDVSKAVSLYLAAAMSGDTASQVALASMYERGTGVDVDPLTAYAFFSLAAQDQNPDALAGLDRTRSALSPRALSEGQTLYDRLKQSVKNRQ